MAKVTFTPPKDYQPPEDVAEGAEFDESVTLKYEGDKLCVVGIGGVPLPGYEKDEGKKATVPASFAQRVTESIMPPMAPPGGGGEY